MRTYWDSGYCRSIQRCCCWLREQSLGSNQSSENDQWSVFFRNSTYLFDGVGELNAAGRWISYWLRHTTPALVVTNTLTFTERQTFMRERRAARVQLKCFACTNTSAHLLLQLQHKTFILTMCFVLAFVLFFIKKKKKNIVSGCR